VEGFAEEIAPRRVARALVAVLCALLAAACAAPAKAASPPIQDPFYRYSLSDANGQPGSVLRTRQVDIALSGTVPGTATQVLYRTRRQLGAQSATVATIISPSIPGPTELISYQTAYDGVSDSCRPSYAIQSGVNSNAIVTAEGALIAAYLLQGYTVVTSDYEGPTDDYGAGRESGYATLDAIRAAERVLGAPAGSTPVGLVGYSGGSIASSWASELQPQYAPELDVVGVAEGGLPVDFEHNLNYINGSSDWAGAIPAVGIGVGRGQQVDLGRLLGDYGRQVVEEVGKGCLNPSAYPGQTFEDGLKPQYKDWRKVPELANAFNASILGGGTPKVPILMAVGNNDGTGDGVMVAEDVRQLADIYCSRGVPVQLRIYAGLNHVAALAPFEAEAITFFQQRFAGTSPASECASIGPGNALIPLPLTGTPKPVQPLKLTVRRKGRRYVLRARATSWRVDEVTLTIRRIGKKGRKSRGTRRLSLGSVGFDKQAVRLPVKRSAKRARYRIIATGSSGTAPFRQKLKFRAGQRDSRR
jgi:hypothetical protein